MHWAASGPLSYRPSTTPCRPTTTHYRLPPNASHPTAIGENEIRHKNITFQTLILHTHSNTHTHSRKKRKKANGELKLKQRIRRRTQGRAAYWGEFGCLRQGMQEQCQILTLLCSVCVCESVPGGVCVLVLCAMCFSPCLSIPSCQNKRNERRALRRLEEEPSVSATRPEAKRSVRP